MNKDVLPSAKEIVKIHCFYEYLKQCKLEREYLAIVLEKSEHKEELKNEILIYQEIIDEYHIFFQNILHM